MFKSKLITTLCDLIVNFTFSYMDQRDEISIPAGIHLCFSIIVIMGSFLGSCSVCMVGWFLFLSFLLSFMYLYYYYYFSVHLSEWCLHPEYRTPR